MNRVFGLVLVTLLTLVAAAAWLAEQPGSVTITFGDASRQISLVAALALAAGALAGVVLVVDVARWAVRMPTRRAERRAREAEVSGWRAAGEAVVAIAAGDKPAAETALTVAEGALPAEPLVQLTAAQKAQWLGDVEAARVHFAALANGEGAAAGWRGLMIEARRQGDKDAALSAAKAGLERTGAVWAAEAVVELQASAGDHEAAIASLGEAAKKQLLAPDRAKRWRAVLLTAHAEATALAEPDAARRRVVEALALAPELVPAAALAARLAKPKGWRAVMAVLTEAWKRGPHPDLMTVALAPPAQPQDALNRALELAKLAPEHAESRLGVARAALTAGDHGRALASLSPLAAADPEKRVAALMAEIHRASGQTEEALGWLTKALYARPDPCWMGDGRPLRAWAPVSPVSGTLDGVRWLYPPHVGTAAQTAPREAQATARRSPALAVGPAIATPMPKAETKPTSVPIAVPRAP